MHHHNTRPLHYSFSNSSISLKPMGLTANTKRLSGPIIIEGLTSPSPVSPLSLSPSSTPGTSSPSSSNSVNPSCFVVENGSPISYSSGSSSYNSEYEEDYQNSAQQDTVDLDSPATIEHIERNVSACSISRSVNSDDSAMDLNAPDLHGIMIGVEDRSLDSVVSWLVLKNADPELQASFLYTFKLVTSSEDLLAVLQDIAVRLQQQSQAKTILKQTERFFNFMCTWLSCGLERGLFHKILNIVVPVLSQDNINRLKLLAVKDTGLLLKSPLMESGSQTPPATKINVLPKSSSWRVGSLGLPLPFSSSHISFQLTSTSSSLIANQLTIIQWNLISKVQTHEFLKQAWQSPNKEALAPNLTAVCSRFNQVTFWAASEIILSPTLKAQARMIEKLIKIAQKLFELNNFDTLMQVLTGIKYTAVQRLKKVQSKVSSKSKDTLRRLVDFMSPNNNFQVYREHVRNLLMRKVPTIMYIPILLKDITFINDGNSDYIDGYINYEKLFRLGGQICTFMNMQEAPYENLKVDETLNRILLNMKHLSEKRLMQCSLEMEPNEALSGMLDGDEDDKEAPKQINLDMLALPNEGRGSLSRRPLTSRELNAQNLSPRPRMVLDHSRRHTRALNSREVFSEGSSPSTPTSSSPCETLNSLITSKSLDLSTSTSSLEDSSQSSLQNSSSSLKCNTTNFSTAPNTPYTISPLSTAIHPRPYSSPPTITTNTISSSSSSSSTSTPTTVTKPSEIKKSTS